MSGGDIRERKLNRWQILHATLLSNFSLI